MQLTVSSGKGGTGKTTVAVNLALALAQHYNYKIQFLDCDVEEPDAHIFLQPQIEEREPVYIKKPEVDLERCNFCGQCAKFCQFNALAVIGKRVIHYPELCHGCGLCRLVCPQDAISEYDVQLGVIERGTAYGFKYLQGILTIGEPPATPVIRALKKKINAVGPQPQIAILDSAPGTGCPVIETMHGSDFVLLVTEPTPFGLHDLKLTVEVLKTMNIPKGVIINRDGVGYKGVEEYCAKEGIPILMRIPMNRRIAELYSVGVPFVMEMPEWKGRFIRLYEEVRKTCTRVHL